MAKLPSAQKDVFWRQTFAQFAQSGLSARDFCQQQNLMLHSFYFWKRNIRRRDRVVSETKQQLPTLVPVSILKPLQPLDGNASSSPAMRISLPGNIVVEIFTGEQRD